MALISGKEVKKGPKQLPKNPKLWNMLTTQARSKFRTYPSPAAAHWVHSRYVALGGGFATSAKDIDPRMRDYAHEAQEKKEEAQKKKVTKDIGRNNIRGERFR